MEQILRAILTSRVYEIARETSLDAAPRLSKRVGNSVWLKREDQQPVFSFKIRGAYNRIARLSQAERAGAVSKIAGAADSAPMAPLNNIANVSDISTQAMRGRVMVMPLRLLVELRRYLSLNCRGCN